MRLNNQTKKKKRQTSPRSKEVTDMDATRIYKTVDKLLRKTMQLTAMLKKNASTKVQLKAISKEIEEEVKALKKSSELFKAWKDTTGNRGSTIVDELQQLAGKNIHSVEVQTDTDPDAPATGISQLNKTGSTCTCTCAASRLNSPAVLKPTLEYDVFENTRALQWESSVYTNTAIIVGNPVAKKGDDVKVVIVEPDDPDMKASVQRLYRDKFPELQELQVIRELFPDADEAPGIQDNTESRIDDNPPLFTSKEIKIAASKIKIGRRLGQTK
ncbi:hypothetical protein JTB14_035794 [Gonioctena quinquepunctata]|nr:hypothetical protein JTB14_035794 [Gonioctena quinquepunctata]